jgi:hypothetical protein
MSTLLQPSPLAVIPAKAGIYCFYPLVKNINIAEIADGIIETPFQ